MAVWYEGRSRYLEERTTARALYVLFNVILAIQSREIHKRKLTQITQLQLIYPDGSCKQIYLILLPAVLHFQLELNGVASGRSPFVNKPVSPPELWLPQSASTPHSVKVIATLQQTRPFFRVWELTRMAAILGTSSHVLTTVSRVGNL